MDHYRIIIIVFLATTAINDVHGFGTGAPTSACTSMMPGHIRTVPHLYSTRVHALHVSSTTYQYGTPITVTVTGTYFRGLLMEARRVGGNTPLGWFSSPALGKFHLLSCNSRNDAITHSNEMIKFQENFIWHPPYMGVGDVEFVATIAQSREVYWIGIKSVIISEKIETTITALTTIGRATYAGTTLPGRTTNAGMTSPSKDCGCSVTMSIYLMLLASMVHIIV